ncbi:MAG TPA: thermonuclease family protein [Steroidobacter sp.]
MSSSANPCHQSGAPSRSSRSLASATGRVLATVLAGLLCVTSAYSHPGRVDANGCHRQAGSGKHCHSERSRANAPKFDPDNPPRPGDEGVFYGPLVRVGDGDTLYVKVQGVVMEFRLAEVDAPELAQPYGEQAKRVLTELLAGADRIVLMPFDTDRYGRTVAHVWAGKTHVNAEMIRRGAAWFYAAYARGDALYHVEQEARDARRGLWALPLEQRLEPWVWRERKR